MSSNDFVSLPPTSSETVVIIVTVSDSRSWSLLSMAYHLSENFWDVIVLVNSDHPVLKSSSRSNIRFLPLPGGSSDNAKCAQSFLMDYAPVALFQRELGWEAYLTRIVEQIYKNLKELVEEKGIQLVVCSRVMAVLCYPFLHRHQKLNISSTRILTASDFPIRTTSKFPPPSSSVYQSSFGIVNKILWKSFSIARKLSVLRTLASVQPSHGSSGLNVYTVLQREGGDPFEVLDAVEVAHLSVFPLEICGNLPEEYTPLEFRVKLDMLPQGSLKNFAQDDVEPLVRTFAESEGPWKKVEKPVYMCLSSALSSDQLRRTLLLVAEAMLSLGCKFILHCPGREEECLAPLSSLGVKQGAEGHCLVVGSLVPPEIILEFCGAAVVDGSAYIVIQALSKAIPFVILSHESECEWAGWALQSVAGCLPPLKVSTLSLDQVTRSIATLVASDGLKQSADILQAQIQNLDKTGTWSDIATKASSREFSLEFQLERIAQVVSDNMKQLLSAANLTDHRSFTAATAHSGSPDLH